MQSLTCVHTLYNNNSINTKYRFQNSQYYMCTYPLQQLRNKNEGSFPKFPVLHMFIPSTTKQTYTQRLASKMSSLKCVNILYEQKNINTKVS